MNTILARAAKDPIFFGHALLNWHAFPAQALWLRNSQKPLNLCRAGNRWGKTESVAIKHLWKCCFKIRDARWSYDSPYRTVNTSISLDQASLPIHKAWQIVNREENRNFFNVFIKRLVRTPFPRIEFKNQSTFWARSTARHGEYLEGWDFDYASYDECAFDPQFAHILDEVLSLRLLDRGGQIDCISTGKRGSAFNERFNKALLTPDLNFTYQGKTTDNPNLDQTALNRLINTLDSGLLEERIYGGERPNEGRIPHASIMRAIRQSTGLNGAYSGKRYSTGWDLAKTRNMTVGVTLDITGQPYQVVAWEAFNQNTLGIENEMTYWEHVWNRILNRWKIYGGMTHVDVTGIGSIITDYLSEIQAEPLSFSGQRVNELIACIEIALGLGVLGFPLLEMERPDTSRWNIVNELEELNNELTGLDTTTAIALSLWGVRKEIQGKIPIILSPRIVGITDRVKTPSFGTKASFGTKKPKKAMKKIA